MKTVMTTKFLYFLHVVVQYVYFASFLIQVRHSNCRGRPTRPAVWSFEISVVYIPTKYCTLTRLRVFTNIIHRETDVFMYE